MQDRFKFRIWHKPLKIMHYNDFVITSTGYVAPIQEEVKGIDYMMRFNQQDIEFDKQCVIMQCTGMKDTNGKLIYEGDIIERIDTKYIQRYIVNWDISGYWAADTYSLAMCSRVLQQNYKVIGNKYENPELLEVKKMATIKPKYIICDLDGCLIDSAWIWDFIKSQSISKDEAFDIFNRLANAENNKIDIPMYKYLCFKGSGGFKIHFMTARSEIIEVETINFIQRKTGLVFGKDFTISFRAKNDFSTAAESKGARVQKFINDGNLIEIAIDDDNSVLEMYKSKNIPCMKWIIGFIPTKVVGEYNSQITNLINVREVICQN